jgi:hypothetical protein
MSQPSQSSNHPSNRPASVGGPLSNPLYSVDLNDVVRRMSENADNLIRAVQTAPNIPISVEMDIDRVSKIVNKQDAAFRALFLQRTLQFRQCLHDMACIAKQATDDSRISASTSGDSFTITMGVYKQLQAKLIYDMTASSSDDERTALVYIHDMVEERFARIFNERLIADAIGKFATFSPK